MRAPSLSSAKLGARLKPEERPVYAHRRIVASVEIRFPLPPSTNSLFFNAPGVGRIKTPRYRRWRHNAVLAICSAKPVPGRMAGPCDIAIYLPAFRGDIDNRVKPCLDVAVAAGKRSEIVAYRLPADVPLLAPHTLPTTIASARSGVSEA